MSVEQPRRPATVSSSSDSALNGSVPEAGVPSGGELRCQWCSVALKPGVTLCPTCGSPGVPDPRYTKDEPERVPDPLGLDVGMDQQVVAPWRDDDPFDMERTAPASAPARKKMTIEEAESRQKQTLLFAGAAVLVCVLLGWIAGPLLAGAIENFTGTPVENSGDLRPMGAFLGMLGGLFVGGLGGIVIWASR